MTAHPIDPTGVAGEVAATAGIEQAAAGAPTGWQAHALGELRQLAAHHPYVCADDLWAAGLPPPPEPRALGGVFRAAVHTQTRRARRGRTP